MILERFVFWLIVAILVALSLRSLAYAAGLTVGLVRWWRSPERRLRQSRQKAIAAMARVGEPRRSDDTWLEMALGLRLDRLANWLWEHRRQ